MPLVVTARSDRITDAMPAYALVAMARKSPTDSDRAEAVSRVLSGLARGEELSELAAAVEHLHPPHNTFPGEVFLRLAGEALEQVEAGRDNPVAYEGLLDRYLVEHRFMGRENRKIQFAILAGAAARGGIEPDLLDEVIWWQTDDFWFYALAAVVAVIRACAERTGQPMSAFTERLAARTSST
jgi:hypothetical protein